MKPLNVRKTGSYSIAFPQHFCIDTNINVSKRIPTKMTPNDKAKPLLQMKSPVVQKVSIFLLKLTIAVVSLFDIAEVFKTDANR
jgi:hypothetical protein